MRTFFAPATALDILLQKIGGAPPASYRYAILTHGGPTSVGPSNSATRYGPFANGGAVSSWTTPATNARSPVGAAMTITKIKAAFPIALTQGSYVITLVVNAVDTALTCTIDTTHSVATGTGTVSLVAGDDVCWKIVPSGTPEAQTSIQLSAVVESADGAQPIFSGHNGQTTSNFSPLGGLGFGTETLASSIFAAPGTITRFDVRLPVAPGTSTSRVYTLRKNGVDTGLTVTYSDSDVGLKSSTGTTITFARGDVASISCVVTGVPASSIANFGLLFTPTTLGQGIVFTTWNGAISSSADRYGAANGWTASTTSTEAQVQNIAPSNLTLSHMISQISTGPGSGLARNFAAMVAGFASALTANITNTATTGGDTTTNVSVTEGDSLSVRATPSGNPAAVTWAQVGMTVTLEAP